MATRVTQPEVEAILIDDNPDDVDVTPFIQAANVTIDAHLLDRGLSTAQLKEIERWLAAHFFSIRERLPSSESIGGDTSITYEGKHGLGLDHTSYGQQVKMLDTSGVLSEIGMPRAQFSVISTRELP